MANRTCSLGDGKPVRARGWCRSHYRRWQTYGDPLGVPATAAATPAFPHHGEAEEWRAVVGFEGLYEVSSLGRVRSLQRATTFGRILKPWVQPGYGYLAVKLSRDAITSTMVIHKLVAEAFLGSCPPGQQVRHGPNGKLDNRASQLKYGTPDENGADMVRDGNSNYGVRGFFAKLDDAKVTEIRRLHAAGMLQKTIAARFGIVPSSVSHIVNGKTWRHLLAGPPPPPGLLF